MRKDLQKSKMKRISSLTNLTKLNLGYCKTLENLDGLANLTNLKDLELTDCNALKNIDGLSDLPNFKSLIIKNII